MHGETQRLNVTDMVPAEIPESAMRYFLSPRAGIGWGELTNATGETLLVYGPKAPGEVWDNSLYCLPTGYTTPLNWDCDGFYLPNDRIANQLVMSNVAGPAAVKYYDFRSPVITMTIPGQYDCGGNNGIYTVGTIHWFIPNIPQITVEAVCA
jgi:hypothetical protein